MLPDTKINSIKKAKLVAIPGAFQEERAELHFIEASKEIGFYTKRIYYISNVKSNEERGSHAHKKLEQFFIALNGSFEIELERGNEKLSFTLNSRNQGLYLPAGYWRVLKNFSKDAVCLVLASEEYEEKDYIRDYDDFLTWQNKAIDSVPYLDFSRYYEDLKLELDKAYFDFMKSSNYILGTKVQELEKEFAKYSDAKYAVGVSNGLEALELVLKAWNIGKGDEVIVPANSFIATALAVSNTGAKVVFTDVCPQTCNIITDEKLINSKTKAIIPVHLYGNPAEMQSLKDLQQKYNFKILEDAAQAHGAVYQNQKIGSLGDAAAFSFYPTKNLGALGDGGIITTNDERLYQELKLLRNYGSRQKYHHETIGKNARLDELQAAFLLVKLKKLDEWSDKKRDLAKIYYDRLSKIAFINLPQVTKNSQAVFHVFAIQVKKELRNKLKSYLEEYNIGTNIHYPIPIHKQKAYSDYNHLSFPVSERLSEEILSLPLDAYHSEDEINYVCDIILKFVHQAT
ncbi:MAG: aminotransferase class V-fold PLP-dependent enzyme [Candidatus Caenarcaniphilales bacterium]|jgi:dTDP-4-amino-4,6-dideoxygalactose transaminase/dTDP-4-dehydrorhamnose 3,5-epimerase-like enzyme|nr:aminotransferase class V-fold PLP-dependent enzyme [Candidatus Caenarcaniphilales bacterium]